MKANIDKETERKSISLPEPADTVSTMLQELYNVYNPTTGSIFTNFALRCEVEKESVMSNLLDLFAACDKYNLESLKKRAAHAIIDRLPFVHDAVTIVDIAACIYDESCPDVDCGLHRAIIAQIQARLPTIMGDEAAWETYSSNKLILKAIHERHCAAVEEAAAAALLSPPVSPSPSAKRGRAQVRASGG
jgi:histone acetyltransferase HTATIP